MAKLVYQFARLGIGTGENDNIEALTAKLAQLSIGDEVDDLANCFASLHLADDPMEQLIDMFKGLRL